MASNSGMEVERLLIFRPLSLHEPGMRIAPLSRTRGEINDPVPLADQIQGCRSKARGSSRSPSRPALLQVLADHTGCLKPRARRIQIKRGFRPGGISWGVGSPPPGCGRLRRRLAQTGLPCGLQGHRLSHQILPGRREHASADFGHPAPLTSQGFWSARCHRLIDYT